MRMTRSIIATLMTGLLLTISAAAQMPRTASPTDAQVYIQSPADGATVTSPVTVRFGLAGMGVAPAGVDKANTGHHHLLIDIDPLPALDQPLPQTDQVRHFGGGQTEADIELTPGEHSLQLVLGDYLHIPHEPPLISQKIIITVSEDIAPNDNSGAAD